MPRAAEPDDFYRFRIPTDPRLSPDGRLVALTLQTTAPRHDGYRSAIWLVPADGSRPARQVSIGQKRDHHPRFAPDGRTLAFLSDRRLAVEEEPDLPPDPKDREDLVQVHLLPLDGGEARRLTDLPRGVKDLVWSPDGSSLVVTSASHGATRDEDARRRGRDLRRERGAPPESDIRYVDRLANQWNGEGFVYDRVVHIWLIDAETGEARRLTNGSSPDLTPVWSPDGTRIAYVANRNNDHDIRWRSDIWVVDVASGGLTRITNGGFFDVPAWLPDGRTIAAIGHRFPAEAGSRNDVWLFAADGSDNGRRGGRNISERHDLMPGSSMASDLVPSEAPRLLVSADGGSLIFTAPDRGAYELWRIGLSDGAAEQLTKGRHEISGWDAVAGPRSGTRLAFLRAAPTTLADACVLDVATARRREPAAIDEARRLTSFNDDILADITRVEPQERWSTVDGRQVQGWYVAPVGASSGSKKAHPLVTEIHGGPHSFYGWSPFWEFQVLAGSGIGVYFSNPRGSEGYGQDFNAANFRDWGDGPMRDVMAGIDSLIADGLADPDRLGVTGGSYGGYLTSWIVGHTDRFAAAITCRSVNDLTSQMTTGDIAGGEFGRLELGKRPWEDLDLYRELSPLTYAQNIRTPLLIQHSEKDLRTPIGQAEELFTVLRSLRRPVRLMRVPEESHELTRSGTPFRRVENWSQIRAWFRHFLIDGSRRLPPIPKVHGGR